MGPEIEAVVPVINCRAHGVNEAVVAEIQTGIRDFPVTGEIMLFGRHSPAEAERALMGEYEAARKREGNTVFVVAGGDGSLQKVRNLFAREGEIHDHVVFLHVPTGFVNGNKFVFGVKPRSDAIHNVLLRGHILPIDHMAVTLTPDSGKQVSSLALLSVGANDAHMLKRVELARELDGTSFVKLIEGTMGIGHMDPVGVTIRDEGGVIYQGATMLTETIGGQKLLHVPLTSGTLMDGWMTTLIVPAENRTQGVGRAILGMLAGTAGLREENPFLVQVSGAEVQIAFDRPVPAHLDGEVQPEICVLDIACVPGGTRFLVA